MPGTKPIDTKKEHVGDADAQLLHQFRDRMNDGWGYWHKNHEKAAEDLNFAYVSLWPEEVKAQREAENRPALEINVIPQFISQVTGIARNSKFSIHVSPKSNNDLGAKRSDGSRISTAEVVEGIIRDVESRSDAHEVYCMALQHAVEGGFGWIRIRTERMPDDPFNLEVVIEHVVDRYSVIYDPYATRSDLKDAEWACMTILMPRAEFDARYPDLSNSSTIGSIDASDNYPQQFYNWWGNDHNSIRISEYYYKEPMVREAHQFYNEETREELVLYKDEHEAIFDELKNYGFVWRASEEVDSYRVKVMKCLADTILEKPEYWPGIHIPIVPVFGRKIDMGGGYRMYNSLIRYAHDPARMNALWMSDMTERVANSPKVPFILSADQIDGHENAWKRQTMENAPFLLYNHMEDQPFPQRQHGATTAAAEIQVSAQAMDIIRHSTGIHESNLGQKSNETSGLAIEKRQDAGNNSVYEFIDNLSTGVRGVGDVLVDLIPKIYKDEAIRRIEMPSGHSTLVTLNQQILDEESGEKYIVNSVSLGRYGCRVTSGPGYATQREEAYRNMVDLGRTNPDIIKASADLMLRMSNMPNADQIARRVLQTIPRSMLTPEEKEAVGEQEPTPEEQAEMKKSEAEMAKAEASVKIAELSVQAAEINLQSKQIEKEISLDKKASEVEAADGEEGADKLEKKDVEKMFKEMMAKHLSKKVA